MEYQQSFIWFKDDARVTASARERKAAQQCRTAAAALDKHIRSKHESADRMLLLPPTRKRLATAEAIRRDAVRLEQIRATLLQLAKMHEDGTITPELLPLTSATAVQRALFHSSGNSAIHRIFAEARRTETQSEKALRLEREALVKRIPGFVPTPPELAVQLVRFAEIEAGIQMLEPSAGTGALIDAILQQQPNISVSYCEINCYLLDVLRAKYEGDHRVHFETRDCEDLAAPGEKRFHRVVMNPPFEHGRDIEHVRLAYHFLRPGGILAAIVSEGAFSRSDRKATEFRDFLRSREAEVRSLPPEAFKMSGTRVRCRMIAIQAPA